MSLIDVDSWLTEYDACERLSREIQSQLIVRNKSQVTKDYSQISGIVRIRLRQFSSELEELHKKLQLAAQIRQITVEEAERRSRQIEQLRTKLIHLQKQFTEVSVATRPFPGGSGSRGLWDDDDDDEIENTDSYTVEDLRKQQTKILEDQNQGLDVLSEVISRQKHLAIRIGDEVDMQNEIIDTLGDQMERTDTRILNETQHIGLVTKKDATCGYYVVIGMLFIAIVIITLV